MRFLFPLFVFLFFAVGSNAQLLSVKVVRVIDGDSIHVKDSFDRYHIIRFFGIDAPELNQSFGQSAKKYLADLIYNQMINVRFLEKDIYGRTMAYVFDSDGRNINLEMIKTGHAWVYKKYHLDPKWVKFETSAKQAKIGLWKYKSPVPPWIFRRG